MPEFPELLSFAHLIQQGKGFPGSLKCYRSLKFVVQVIPLCLSLGSPKRAFECLYADKGDYLPERISSQKHQIEWLPPEWPPISWRQRAREPWSYLLHPPHEAGELVCASRGKLLVIAAGNHAVCISLGLEGHVFGMSPEDFFDIIKKDIPGPNEEATKAEQIRTFLIPERLIVPDSSSTRPRTIKIFAAFISSDWVYVLCDFTGLVRMSVKSKQCHWTSDDLAPGSEQWDFLFDSLKGGPDWIIEKPLAMEAIREWRAAILKEHSDWEQNVQGLQATYEQKLKEYISTQRLESFFQPKNPRRAIKIPPAPALPVFPTQPFRPIIREICANSLGAFSGFGRHTANDFLFLQAIFPGMPCHLICENESVFEGFVSAIRTYMESFTTDEFYKRIVSVTNSDNPFSFNEESNEQYMKSHILVFRRLRVKVDRDLYIRYFNLGYLDPDHTMGEEYSPKKAIKKVKQWTWLPVYLDGFNAYSVIQAQCPTSWAGRLAPLVKKLVKKDIAQFGYNTTIGLAQFREQVLNRVRHSVNTVKVGRPRKEYTGKKGRPAKVKSTKKSQETAKAKMLGRKPRLDMDALMDKIVPDDMTTELDVMDVDTLTDPNGPTATNTDAPTDVATTADMEADAIVVVLDQDPDPDDNAGDADATGDGSAYTEDTFIHPEDHEVFPEAAPESEERPAVLIEKESQTSKVASQPTVLGMPVKDLHDVLRDAHYVYRKFRYTNPYNHPLNVPRGVMTYWRANVILREWHTLGLNFMAPFLTRRRRHGTTLPK